MGFFSELKEDLSQAVNELLPVEDGPDPETPAEETRQTTAAGAAAEKARTEPESISEDIAGDISEDISLEKLLENIEDVQLPEKDEAVLAAESVEEPVEAPGADASEAQTSMEELLAAALAAIPEQEDEKPGEAPEPEETAADSGMTAMVGNGTAVDSGMEAMAGSGAADSGMTAMTGSGAAADSDMTAMAGSDAADSGMTTMAGSETAVGNGMTAMTGSDTAADSDMTAAVGGDTAAPEKYSEEKIQEETPAERVESKGAKGKMDSYTGRQVLDETAVITQGMQICGDVMSEGSLDVIGAIEGNIDILGKLNITGHINGNSKAAEIYAEGAKINGEIVSEGAVKIGDSSVIIGNITAKSAAIAGAVKGDIDVQGPVILDSTAIVMGNIKSKSVQINNGACIEGMCSQCYADVSPTSFFNDYKPEIKSGRKKAVKEKGEN